MDDENRAPPRNALRKYPALVLLVLVSAAALLLASGQDISLTSPATTERAPLPSKPLPSPAPASR